MEMSRTASPFVCPSFARIHGLTHCVCVSQPAKLIPQWVETQNTLHAQQSTPYEYCIGAPKQSSRHTLIFYLAAPSPGRKGKKGSREEESELLEREPPEHVRSRRRLRAGCALRRMKDLGASRSRDRQLLQAIITSPADMRRCSVRWRGGAPFVRCPKRCIPEKACRASLRRIGAGSLHGSRDGVGV
ncbi:hypothetical protein BU23DRAFT_51964 [Bimuria novae-zelandiae CBS 107.79]|uniref:Uncharacterized protein n=1 Tax=Bimuria novae-zelandiae CBS 107.79 TaxID=1447943 RepID=A0A6A5UIJ2_9PLEO|nr:hypothetical protein BU23DRAFT_51964 [Bimuria novae-zelandiae CBS 107.79]